MVPPVAPAPGSWCGLTRRRSSANEGPGSEFTANNGNALGSDIGRGAYCRGSGSQGDHPPPRKVLEFLVTVEVCRRRHQTLDVVLELADAHVAVPTEDAPHASGDVVVI